MLFSFVFVLNCTVGSKGLRPQFKFKTVKNKMSCLLLSLFGLCRFIVCFCTFYVLHQVEHVLLLHRKTYHISMKLKGSAWNKYIQEFHNQLSKFGKHLK